MENYCQYQQRVSACLPSRLESKYVWLQRCYAFFAWLGFGHKTFWGLVYRLNDLKAQGQSLLALQLILDELEYQYYWRDHEEKWWSLMRKAVSLSQDLQLEHKEGSKPLLRIMALIKNAPQPWQGYDVAYSFVTLSLWSFIQGKSQAALSQVKTALHADPSWAYPEYLLGWYGLWLEGVDPVKHFVRAIQLDWRYFKRLKQDPHCQQYPEVLSAVKQAILVHK